MRHMSARLRRRASHGYSLIELLFVAGIIGIMVAVAAPPISNYFKTYAIRSAATQVAGELQAARNRAIMRNATLGVVFVTESPTTYRFVVEDDQDFGDGFQGARLAMTTLMANAQQAAPLKTLPAGIVFATATPNEQGIRFGALGGACEPGSSAAQCPDLALGAPTTQINYTAATGFTLTLSQTRTGLFKSVLVSSGGRVNVKEGWQP